MKQIIEFLLCNDSTAGNGVGGGVTMLLYFLLLVGAAFAVFYY